MVQLGAFLYLAVAVLYTTTYLLVSPVSSLASYLSKFATFGIATSFSVAQSANPRVDLLSQALHAQKLPDTEDKHAALMSFLASDDLLYWPNSSPVSPSTIPIREETFLSRAFSQSMHPTKIIPFFYKASGPIDEGDVTITTLVTSNRFPVLRKLVDRYQGAPSQSKRVDSLHQASQGRSL